MTVQEVLKKHSKIEIELILTKLLDKPKEFLFMYPEYKLTRKEENRLTQMVRRRKKGEPVAYILGYKDFMGLRFKVNKHVLIPRPETEWLVEKVMEHEIWNMKRKRPVRILDLGTGSGCIAVSLAKQLKEIQNPRLHLPSARADGGQANSKFQIVASDISQKALKLAKENAHSHRAKIQFTHSNILQNIGMSFDVIVANLPYVPRKYYASSIKYLGWEPKQALVDPIKEFNVYKRFFQEVEGHLNKKALILLEIDPKAKTVLSKFAKQNLPSSGLKFHKDFNRLWRYMEIKT